MEINIYWNDLAEDVQTALLEQNFDPNKDQISEKKPIGILHIEIPPNQ